MDRRWQHYQFKNLTLAVVSLLATIVLVRKEPVHSFLFSLHEWGYLGAFFAGMMFTSIFTVSIGAVLLLILAEHLQVWELALIGGMGAVCADILIFNLIKSKGLTKEIQLIVKHLGGERLSQLIHTRYFAWTLPVLGAIIIASPLPDEFGVTLMGISKLSRLKFILVCFVLDFIGIAAILSASSVIKP